MPPLLFSLIEGLSQGPLLAQLPFAAPDGAALLGAPLLGALGTVASLGLLEAVLSADNAVALAGLVAGVRPPERRARILNQGLLCAFLLRGLMILAASWILQFEALRVLGGLYLVWLALRHFQEQFEADEDPLEGAGGVPATSSGSTLSLLAVIACTDLAFSIDSVSAAVAVSDNIVLVLIGGALGVAMLRFLAGWVILWMERFVHLANAAYLTVLAVGLRMLARCLAPALDPPQGVMLLLMAVLLAWGFSSSREACSSQTLALEPSSPGSGVCSTPVLTRANTARL